MNRDQIKKKLIVLFNESDVDSWLDKHPITFEYDEKSCVSAFIDYINALPNHPPLME